MNRFMRWVTIGLLVAGVAAPPAGATVESVELRGCLLTGNIFDRDAAEVSGTFVPDGYTLGDWSGEGMAALSVWVFDCDTGRVVPGAPSDRTGIAMIGVQVQQRPTADHPDRGIPYLLGAATGEPGRHLGYHVPLNAPNLWDLYVTKLLASDEDMVERLASWGFPASRADVSVRSLEPYGLLDATPRTADVVGGPGPFVSEVTPSFQDHVHFHDNLLFHGADPDTAATVIVTIPHANDRYCIVLDGCGSVRSTLPGGWMSEFLGADERTDPSVSFDHEIIDRVIFSNGGS